MGPPPVILLNPLLAPLKSSETFGARSASFMSGCWVCTQRETNTKMKHGVKPKFIGYRKILENKADEVRRSMSAQKAAQVVARLDCPSDEGDLSQQHHEEWIFLNRNTIDMKLLREIADALHRIETGIYATCMECDEPISQRSAKTRWPAPRTRISRLGLCSFP